ncbi:MAG: response regulator, partial [Flavobacteriaceae bacterium]|nr:response regulator [Flavobacteriaceae bacterium]
NKEISSLLKRKNEKAIMDTLRITSSQFISVEEGLLEGRVNDADASASRGVVLVIIVSLLAIVIGIVAVIFISRSIFRMVGGEPSDIAGITEQIAQGNFEVGLEKWNGAETGILASVKSMLEALKTNKTESDRNNWLRIGRADLNDQIRGVLTAEELSRNIITFLCEYIQAKVGIFYMNNGEGVFKLKASYAYQIRKNLSNEFKTGEGLIGQAALEKHTIVLTNVPDDYIRVTSGLGEKSPRNIIVVPIIFNDYVTGILEMGSFEELNELQMTFLEEVSNGIAIALNSAQTRTQLADSLEKTQQQAHELRRQQEELQSANEELEEQTQMLLKSEEKLKAQQEELQVSNEELEETNESLKRQKSEIERTRREIEIKADELAIASKYKSEFLANMSHELRTPLNSLLILSKLLVDNREGTLTEGQVESAEVIYKSGNDLLLLINEILDLAKIEAGRMDIHPAKILMKDLAENINNNFKPQFDEKGLSLTIKINKTAPEFITSDRQRAEQIIKNLMLNALKFIKIGGVTVEFTLPPKEINLSRSSLTPENSFAIAVKDTGIGIAPEKQKIVFEAFQQAEGGTTREYGGTGLGLSISRELATLLGGEIQLESEKGKGSVFTLYLPLNLESDKKTIRYARKDSEALSKEFKESRAVTVPEKIPDDRNTIKDGDKTILIIEDDPNFAKPLLNQCREKGFKGIVALNGEDGLLLADKFIPEAIILDLYLPGIDGWSVLDTLKNNPDTRHIPIHIMSVDDSTIEAFKKGAVGYLTKPVNKEELDGALDMLEKVSSKRIKDLLLIEDDKNLRNSIIKLIGNGDVKTTAVTNGAEAIEKLQSNKYDCMILDLGLPDITGFE